MIFAGNLQNIKEMFDEIHKESAKDRIMVKYMSGEEIVEIKTPVFFENIDRYAAKLTKCQLTDGHIGIIGPNCYEWLVSFGAVLRLGAVAVLIAENETPEEIISDVRQTDIRAILYSPSLKKRLEETGLIEKISCIPFFSSEDPVEEPLKIAENQKGPEDPACIFFTSGTCGTKKAVVHSNHSLIAGQCNNIVGHSFTSQLAVLPFHHLAGFNILFNTWCLGGTICLAEDMRYFFHYLKSMKPDYVFAVPSIAKVLVRRIKKSDDYGASLGWNLRLLNCGGAKFDPEILNTLLEHKIKVMNCYGASEAGGIGLTCDMTQERLDTIGKPSEYIEAKIVDEELLLRSETTMLGYYNEPEATAAVLKDGWYYTGDLCYQDEDGYLYLRGRKNNLIILSNGEKISPEELEAKINTLPKVVESMVTVNNDFLAAWIVADETDVKEDMQKEEVRKELQRQIDRLNENLPGYKRIANVFFRNEPFEKNAMGKIVRTGRKVQE